MDHALADRLHERLLGKPLVGNAFRGTLVEAMLSLALEPEWRWCADGWGSFDFEGPNGVGLEVKQSAARQDWHDGSSRPNCGRFDIAERTGRWEGNTWIPGKGRAAELYVFAWHPIFDPVVADHRAASQWQFYILHASALPNQKSLSLGRIKEMTKPVGIEEIRDCLNSLGIPSGSR